MDFTVPREMFEEVSQVMGYRLRMVGEGGVSAFLETPEGDLEAFTGPSMFSLSASYRPGRDPAELRRQVESCWPLVEALKSWGAPCEVGDESPPLSHGKVAVRRHFARVGLLHEQVAEKPPRLALLMLLQSFREAVMKGALPAERSCDECGQLPAEPVDPLDPGRRLCAECQGQAAGDARAILLPDRSPKLFHYLAQWAEGLGTTAPERLECTEKCQLLLSDGKVWTMGVNLWEWLSPRDFRALAVGALAQRRAAELQGQGDPETEEALRSDLFARIEALASPVEYQAASARLFALERLGDQPYLQPASAWSAVLSEAQPDGPAAATLCQQPSPAAHTLLNQGLGDVMALQDELRSAAAARPDRSQERHARQVERLKAWLQDNPNQADGWHALALLHLGREEWPEAAEAARRALDWNPTHSEAIETRNTAEARMESEGAELPPEARWLLETAE